MTSISAKEPHKQINEKDNIHISSTTGQVNETVDSIVVDDCKDVEQHNKIGHKILKF